FYAFNIAPSESNVTLTYAAHFCYPFYETLIRKAKIDYRRAINEIYGHLKNNEKYISLAFEKLIAKSHKKISATQLCFYQPNKSADSEVFSPTLIEESIEEVLEENYKVKGDSKDISFIETFNQL
ncbi:MAG: hypothetical protein MHMPM18_002482, partial [Marteilia pararefringens]